MASFTILALLVACFFGHSAAIPFSEFPESLTNFSIVDEDRQIVHPNRIVGGVQAADKEFPFITSVRVLYSGTQYHICGGAIVTQSCVITAAHCAQETQSTYRLMAGAYDFSNPSGNEQTRSVDKIIVHPDYDSNSIQNDVAILKVSAPFELDGVSVAAVQLADSSIPPPQTAVVTGWGTLSSGASGLPSALQKVSVPFVPDATCQKAYQNINPVVESMVCYGVKGKDSCQGDSGGPLIGYANGVPYEYGTVSWGVGCAEAKYPGVYTRIPSFYDWLTGIIAANC